MVPRCLCVACVIFTSSCSDRNLRNYPLLLMFPSITTLRYGFSITLGSDLGQDSFLKVTEKLTESSGLYVSFGCEILVVIGLNQSFHCFVLGSLNPIVSFIDVIWPEPVTRFTIDRADNFPLLVNRKKILIFFNPLIRASS